jgi:hypothetical protein
MKVSPPFLPYALVAPTFPFRHLAALAGRAPIGGAREVALGCFMAARLASQCVRTDAEADHDAREARAEAARSWLGTLTLPTAVRTPLARCFDSSASGDSATLAREVTSVRVACTSFLDAASRAELDALAEALSSRGDVVLPTRVSEP